MYKSLSYWTLEEALALIRGLQPETRKYGYHLTLGGGVLNKGESKKDLDLFFLLMNSGYKAKPDELVGYLDKLWGAGKEMSDGRYPDDPAYVYRLVYDYGGLRIDIFVAAKPGEAEGTQERVEREPFNAELTSLDAGDIRYWYNPDGNLVATENAHSVAAVPEGYPEQAPIPEYRAYAGIPRGYQIDEAAPIVQQAEPAQPITIEPPRRNFTELYREAMAAARARRQQQQQQRIAVPPPDTWIARYFAEPNLPANTNPNFTYQGNMIATNPATTATITGIGTVPLTGDLNDE